ncbi:SRPBCC domain-containing protein [bacterium]|nr:SRPBCC domain-containing protein [bacterium]
MSEPRFGNETLERRIQISMPGDTELFLTRELKARPQLVWDAHTKPELIKRWLTGPPGWSMPHCEVDLRVGGRFRYEWAHENGQQMGMSGSFTALVEPQHIAHTEIFDEDWSGGEMLVSTDFKAQGEGTLIEMRIVFSSKEARDGALATGMTEGMDFGYGLLEKLLDGQL